MNKTDADSYNRRLFFFMRTIVIVIYRSGHLIGPGISEPAELLGLSHKYRKFRADVVDFVAARRVRWLWVLKNSSSEKSRKSHPTSSTGSIRSYTFTPS
jgi:hypothetical protein